MTAQATQSGSTRCIQAACKTTRVLKHEVGLSDYFKPLINDVLNLLNIFTVSCDVFV